MALWTGKLLVAVCYLVCSGKGFLLDEEVIETDEFQVWLTNGDTSSLLQRHGSITPTNESLGFTVSVDRNKTRQVIEGYGASMTNAGAYVIYNSPHRHEIMQDLFGTGLDSLGTSYIRVCIGASDMMAVSPYTYDDLDNANDTDFDMEHFSIDKDRDFVIPILKEAVEINPDLKIMGSPWSAPAWMKKSKHLYGGEFNSDDPQYMKALALYLVKFIQAYEAEGVPIDSISIQNEPTLERFDYPTMIINATAMIDLIKNYLGPMMRENNMTTKILIWDFNWIDPWYPEAVLDDPEARQYISGVTWHGYEGPYDTPARFHEKYPDIGQYLSEFTGGSWDEGVFGNILVRNSRTKFLGQMRVYTKAVILWNIALDENTGPKSPDVGGCTICRPIVTVPSDGREHWREPAYYAMGHLSRFIKTGATCIDSDGDYGWDDLTTAAAVNTDGSTVIVINNPNISKFATFTVEIDGKYYLYSNLPPQSTVTLVK